MNKQSHHWVIAFAVCFLLTPHIAIARTVTFLCEESGMTTMNRFEGGGSVAMNNDQAEGEFSGSTILSGKTPDPQEIGQLVTKGSVKIIPPGQFAKGEVIVLKMSADRGGKTDRLLFNLGLNGPTSSTFISDGVSYSAKCATVE